MRDAAHVREELKEAFYPYVQQVGRAGAADPFQYMDDVRTGALSAMPELLGWPSRRPRATEAMAMITQLKDFMVPVLDQLESEPDTETLAVLLDSWNEVIAHGGEVPAQLSAAAGGVEVCKLL